MKHARGIMTKIQQSKPSLEDADYTAIDSSDDVDTDSLSTEAAELIAENEELYSEAESLDSRADRMGTLVDYVNTQVNTQETGASQNEVALVEQAVDAALDGTGEDVEVVLPSLEAAVGSTISMEGVKEVINNFISATKELLKKAGENFSKFLKGLVSRIAAVKNRIEKIEAKLKDSEVASEVEVNGTNAVYALYNENEYITDFSGSLKGANDFCELLAKVVGPYSKAVLNDHDAFLKEVKSLFEKGSGRSSKKEVIRIELKDSFAKLANKLIKLNNDTFTEGKEFGGLYIDEEKVEESIDFSTAAKNSVLSVPKIYLAGNVPEKTVQVKGISKAEIKLTLDAIKRGVVASSKVKYTDTMVNVDFFTNSFVGDLIFNGYSTAKVISGVNSINRAFANSYVQPQMRLLDHYFRIVNAQLNIIEKAVK